MPTVIITHRKGSYNNFDPGELSAGELALVQTDDPDTNSGSAIYVGVSSNNVQKILFETDLMAAINSNFEDILQNIAQPYNLSSVYTIGDYCIYNNELYKCIETIIVPEQFNTNHWTRITVVVELQALKTALNTKQNILTFDSSPTTGSNNPVTSGGVKSAIDAVTVHIDRSLTESGMAADAAVVGNELNQKEDILVYDEYPTENSPNPVPSGGIKTAIDNVDLTDRIIKGFGTQSVIIGDISRNIATGNQSAAFGWGSIATGNSSHAEGSSTASGTNSHAEGQSAAAGLDSHSEGLGSHAAGSFSHAEGYVTQATHRCQHVFGAFNVEDPSTAASTEKGRYIEIIGNGEDFNNRSNARTLDWDGNETLAGKLTIGVAPTANMDVATKKYVDDTVSSYAPQVVGTGLIFS